MKKQFVKYFKIMWIAIMIIGITGLTGCHQEKELYVYLVRHGQTYSNVQGMLVGGDGNYDLTEKGISDSISLGNNLKDIPFIATYSSTLGRTYDTANYILTGAGQDNMSVEKVEGIKDISWGDAEGYTIQGFIEAYNLDEFPDAFGDANDADFVSPINAESKYNFCNRFQESLLDIAMKHEQTGGNVLVVGHSSMYFWLQRYFSEKDLGELENTSVTVMKYNNGEWELIKYNTIY